MNSTNTHAMGLFICQDLFFGSKVTATAAALGMTVDVVPDAATAVAKAREGQYRCLIIDLATPGLQIAELIQALPSAGRPTTIAFAAHVATNWLDEARQAGCDLVLPRSKFAATLPEVLQRYLPA